MSIIKNKDCEKSFYKVLNFFFSFLLFNIYNCVLFVFIKYNADSADYHLFKCIIFHTKIKSIKIHFDLLVPMEDFWLDFKSRSKHRLAHQQTVIQACLSPALSQTGPVSVQQFSEREIPSHNWHSHQFFHPRNNQ